VQQEKQIDHVISVTVTEINEVSFGPTRFARTLKIKTLLGDEFTLRLKSESRLGLQLEVQARPTAEGLPIPPGAASEGDHAP
jgi:hypothetical protein